MEILSISQVIKLCQHRACVDETCSGETFGELSAGSDCVPHVYVAPDLVA